jgi:hypothetical protein
VQTKLKLTNFILFTFVFIKRTAIRAALHSAVLMSEEVRKRNKDTAKP